MMRVELAVLPQAMLDGKDTIKLYLIPLLHCLYAALLFEMR